MNPKLRDVVAVANPLIMARYDLTVNQLRLFWFMVGHVDSMNDKVFELHEYTVSELLAIFQMDKNRGWELGRVLDDTTNAFLRMEKVLPDGKVGWAKYPLFGRAEYNPGGEILLKLNKELEPFLTELQTKGFFTKLALKSLFNLCPYDYALRLYKIFKQQEQRYRQGNSNEWSKNYSLDFIYNYLELVYNDGKNKDKRKYKKWADLDKYVLRKSEVYINTMTDIKIKIELDKKPGWKKRQAITVTILESAGVCLSADVPAKNLPAKVLPDSLRKKYNKAGINPDTAEADRDKAWAEYETYEVEQWGRLSAEKKDEYLQKANDLKTSPLSGSIYLRDSVEAVAIQQYSFAMRESGSGKFKELYLEHEKYNDAVIELQGAGYLHQK